MTQPPDALTLILSHLVRQDVSERAMELAQSNHGTDITGGLRALTDLLVQARGNVTPSTDPIEKALPDLRFYLGQQNVQEVLDPHLNRPGGPQVIREIVRLLGPAVVGGGSVHPAHTRIVGSNANNVDFAGPKHTAVSSGGRGYSGPKHTKVINPAGQSGPRYHAPQSQAEPAPPPQMAPPSARSSAPKHGTPRAAQGPGAPQMAAPPAPGAPRHGTPRSASPQHGGIPQPRFGTQVPVQHQAPLQPLAAVPAAQVASAPPTPAPTPVTPAPSPSPAPAAEEAEPGIDPSVVVHRVGTMLSMQIYGTEEIDYVGVQPLTDKPLRPTYIATLAVGRLALQPDLGLLTRVLATFSDHHASEEIPEVNELLDRCMKPTGFLKGDKVAAALSVLAERKDWREEQDRAWMGIYWAGASSSAMGMGLNTVLSHALLTSTHFLGDLTFLRRLNQVPEPRTGESDEATWMRGLLDAREERFKEAGFDHLVGPHVTSFRRLLDADAWNLDEGWESHIVRREA